MRTFDPRSASHGAPPSKRKAEALRSEPVPAHQALLSVSPVAAGVVQRKAACACGGGCPSCEKKDGTRLQTKLRVGHAGDASEREADSVAEQVMRMPHQPRASGAETRAGAQRAGGERAGAGLRVSRRESSASPSPHISDAPPAVDRVLRSAGAPLDDSARAFFEPRFGHDFGSVRVHANREAAESAGGISARAYTVGSHIVFGAGEYAPTSEA